MTELHRLEDGPVLATAAAYAGGLHLANVRGVGSWLLLNTGGANSTSAVYCRSLHRLATKVKWLSTERTARIQ